MSKDPGGLIPGPTDIRRAAALLLHANPDGMNVAGVAAIIAEVKDDRRVTELLTAMATIAYSISGTPLGGPEGQAGLAQIITDYLPKEENNV